VAELLLVVHGDELEAVTVVGGDQTERRLNATGVFAMIGASPGPSIEMATTASACFWRRLQNRLEGRGT
jgi:hypothetical protein